jgi:ERCC4-type nuclease
MGSGLRLKLWEPPNGGVKLIYIHNLDGIGPNTKVFLMAGRRQGPITAHFKGDPCDVSGEQVLAAVQAVIPGGDMTWSVLCEFALSQPKARPGPGPGFRASSSAWHTRQPRPLPTQADFDNIDPDILAHPIPQITRIIVDNREPEAFVRLLQGVGNLQVEVGHLVVGDFLVPDQLVVERKTVSDFVNSTIGPDKRLFHQAAALNRSGMHSIILIEGDVYAQDQMSVKSVDGMLSYLQNIRKIQVLHSRSMAHTADRIAKAIRHTLYGLGYADPGSKAPPLPPDMSSKAAYLLTTIDGVSPAIADRLLIRFGTVAGVCGASLKELLQVDGIGPKSAASIVRTLTN